MKTIINRILILIIVLTSCNTFAQNDHFVQNGVIEFEKKSNMYALITKKLKGETDSYYQAAFESYKKPIHNLKLQKALSAFQKQEFIQMG